MSWQPKTLGEGAFQQEIDIEAACHYKLSKTVPSRGDTTHSCAWLKELPSKRLALVAWQRIDQILGPLLLEDTSQYFFQLCRCRACTHAPHIVILNHSAQQHSSAPPTPPPLPCCPSLLLSPFQSQQPLPSPHRGKHQSLPCKSHLSTSVITPCPSPCVSHFPEIQATKQHSPKHNNPATRITAEKRILATQIPVNTNKPLISGAGLVVLANAETKYGTIRCWGTVFIRSHELDHLALPDVTV